MEKRTKDKPWKLKTPPGTSEYTMHVEEKDGKEVLVCTVGKTMLLYDIRCINDLHAMLKKHGDWMELGGADEQKPAKEGTVEAWGRNEKNPVKGWYGLKIGTTGKIRCVPAAVDGSVGPCGSHTRPEGEQDAGEVAARKRHHRQRVGRSFGYAQPPGS